MPHFENFQLNKNEDYTTTPLYIDAKGSQCPGPVMALRDNIKDLPIGSKVKIEVTDPGFKQDVTAWVNITDNKMISYAESDDGVITVVIQKEKEWGASPLPPKEDRLTLIVFNNDMDRGLAAFNIALGAMAVGMQVDIFFTFWGLYLFNKTNTVTQSSQPQVSHLGLSNKNWEPILPVVDI